MPCFFSSTLLKPVALIVPFFPLELGGSPDVHVYRVRSGESLSCSGLVEVGGLLKLTRGYLLKGGLNTPLQCSASGQALFSPLLEKRTEARIPRHCAPEYVLTFLPIVPLTIRRIRFLKHC